MLEVVSCTLAPLLGKGVIRVITYSGGVIAQSDLYFFCLIFINILFKKYKCGQLSLSYLETSTSNCDFKYCVCEDQEMK